MVRQGARLTHGGVCPKSLPAAPSSDSADTEVGVVESTDRTRRWGSHMGL
jgi:hypothetical protein